MTDRWNGLPFSRRIGIRGKAGRTVLAVTAMTAAVFWQADSVRAMPSQKPAAGGHYGAELRITRTAETAEDGEIQKPPERHWDGDGKEYLLDYWETVTVPGQYVSRSMERKIVYNGVEGAEGIPVSIFLEEDVSGSPAEGTLFLRESRIIGEEWQEGFLAPVTFHAYGADEYHGGSLVIPGDAVLETCVSMGGQLLEFMDLSPLDYRILTADWSGESYEDEAGRVCRQAIVSGQKLLRDYEAVYEGEVGWTEPGSQELEMVYRPVSLVSQAASPAADHVPAPEPQDEGREGNLWYWVRSGFVITVGAGLLGITVGLLALLAVWYRQNRREHRRRCLPRIKG